MGRSIKPNHCWAYDPLLINKKLQILMAIFYFSVLLRPPPHKLQ